MVRVFDLLVGMMLLMQWFNCGSGLQALTCVSCQVEAKEIEFKLILRLCSESNFKAKSKQGSGSVGWPFHQFGPD